MSIIRFNRGQNVFDFAPRTKLKLSEIEQIIRKHRVIVPCPSRQTLINMCEDGTLEAVNNAATRHVWLVFEDSFFHWLRSLDGLKEAA